MISNPSHWMEHFLLVWVSIYAFGLILVPPIEAVGKFIFAAEWMLLPLLILLGRLWISGQGVRPPRPLALLWIGLAITYLSGIFRGDLTYRLALYPAMGGLENERFDWLQDGIRWIRWTILFSIPWCFLHFKKFVGKPIRTKILIRFLSTLKWMILISAGLTIGENFGWWSLSTFYNQDKNPGWWAGRSWGTFPSPLEASLVYGFGLLQVVLLEDGRGRVAGFVRNAASIALLFYALKLSGGFSAMIALAVTLSLMITLGRNRIRIGFFAGILSGVLAYTFYLHRYEPGALTQKFDSFTQRTKVWSSWLSVLPEKPWLVFSGIGFSSLNVDSSFMLLTIYGGVCWLLPFILWVKYLSKGMLRNKLTFLMVFWITTWFALDSVGYWGIGRICWVLIALLHFSVESDNPRAHLGKRPSEQSL